MCPQRWRRNKGNTAVTRRADRESSRQTRVLFLRGFFDHAQQAIVRVVEHHIQATYKACASATVLRMASASVSSRGITARFGSSCPHFAIFFTDY